MQRCFGYKRAKTEFPSHRSMIPPDRLPYVSGRGPVDDLELMKMFGEGSSPVPFTLNRNLRVYVSSILCKSHSSQV